MKQYTFKDGFKCVASTREEAIQKHKVVVAGNTIENNASKVIKVIGNKNLKFYKNKKWFYFELPENHLYDTSLTTNGNRMYVLGLSKKDGNFILFTENEEGNDEELILNWTDKGTNQKVLNLYNKVMSSIKKDLQHEIKTLGNIYKMF